MKTIITLTAILILSSCRSEEQKRRDKEIEEIHKKMKVVDKELKEIERKKKKVYILIEKK